MKEKEIDYFKVEEPEPCYFRVIDPKKNQWYCDGKKIIPAICVATQERYLWQRHVLGDSHIFCRPKHMETVSDRMRKILKSYEKSPKGKILKEHPTS